MAYRYIIGGSSQRAAVMTKKKKEKKVLFDPKVLLATVNGGRSISKYRMHQKVFSQGHSADAVFYIQKGKVKITVVSPQGKEAVVTILGVDDFFRRRLSRWTAAAHRESARG